MIALLFGMTAALAWGLHDFCVRFATAKVSPALAFLVVLLVGFALISPFALFYADWSQVTGRTWSYSVLAGAAYALGGFALYRAFDIGPVRLVAPVTGSYPILIVLFRTLGGQLPTLGDLCAVLLIVTGVALVAVLSGEGESHGARRTALRWAGLACLGFALTFFLAQKVSAGAELPTIVIARGAAFLALLAGALVTRQDLGMRAAPWKLLILMAVCDCFALSLVQSAGGLDHPEYAAVASSVFGAVTIFLAWAFLKEQMRPPQWLAMGLVFSGIVWLGV